MRKLFYLTAILIQFGLLAKAQVPDIIRSPVTPSTGVSRNNRAQSDANLYIPYSLRIPRASAFTLNGAKDSIGYVMFNTTSNRFGIYRGSGVWDTYLIAADIPSTLPPSGAAGGDLSGTYPNPVVNKFNSQLPSYYLNYNNLTNKPTIYNFSGASLQFTKGDGTYNSIQVSDVPTLNQNTTGNAGTVTNGIYTTTFNSLGDAHWLNLSGSNANQAINIGANNFTTTGSVIGNSFVFPGLSGSNAHIDYTGTSKSLTVSGNLGINADSQYAPVDNNSYLQLWYTDARYQPILGFTPGTLTQQNANTAAITTNYTAIGLKQGKIIPVNPSAPSSTIASGDSTNMALWKLQTQVNTNTTAITGKEPALPSGTSAQYIRSDKTNQTLNTSVVPEGSNLYYTNARTIGTTLTGYASGAGTVTGTDNILQALQKINGNVTNNTTNIATNTTAIATKVSSISIATPSVLYTSPINFSVTGGAATGTLSLISQTQNTFLAAPNGAAGTPSFRTIVATDLPSLSGLSINNSTSQQTSANFNIDGKGTAGRFVANNTNDSGSPDAAFLVNRTLSANSANGHGFRDNSVFSQNTFAYSPFQANVTFTGTNFDHYAGFENTATMGQTGLLNMYYGFTNLPRFTAGSVTNVWAYYDSPYLQGAAITNYYGYYKTDFNYTSGSVVNNYGSYIADLTRGTGSNWAYYAAGSTRSNFGGGMTAGGGADATGFGTTYNANSIVNDPTASSVGDYYGTGTINAIAADNTFFKMGAQFAPVIGSTNTKNWTRTAGVLYGASIFPTIAANSNTFSVATMIGLNLSNRNLSATSTLTNSANILINNAFTGTVTNRVNYLSDNGATIPTGTWNFYSPSYNNFLGGNLQLGSSTPTANARMLQTTTAEVSTAPVSANDVVRLTDLSTYVPTFTAAGPLTYTSNVIGINQANTSTNGYLSSTDWNTFNNKQSSLTFSTGLTNSSNTITANLATGIAGGQSVYGGTSSADALTLKNYNGAATGYVIDANGMTVGGATSIAGRLFYGGATLNQTTAFQGDFYSGTTIYNTASAVSTSSFGMQMRPVIGALNTQNYTRTNGALYGFQAIPSIAVNTNTFTVSALVGGLFSVTNSSATATLTNGVGVQISPFSATGAITNSTYLLMGTATPPTGNWNIYSATDYNNYLGTGNTLVGAATASAGAPKLDVTGAASISSTLLLGGALTLSNTPTTSAGTYDFLTRNTSTGVVEKVASASIPTVTSTFVTASGTGLATAFTFTYGTLGYTPSNIIYVPTSTAAASSFYISSITGTGFTVTYLVAPVTGTSNITANVTIVK
jgi:hypothetical protein